METLRGSDISQGEKIPTFELEVSATTIVATAVASRDFMAIHHNVELASSQGLPDIILNILSTSGFLERMMERWAGPEAILKNVKFRLGVPVVPGQRVRFDAEVTAKENSGEECLVELAINVSNEMGNHALGTMKVAVPR